MKYLTTREAAQRLNYNGDAQIRKLLDFYEWRVSDNYDYYIEVRCRRCSGKWRVDNKLHTMEVL
jgi:hypothetical protein